MSEPTCSTCAFCLRKDFGYSNVTVEGTKLYCLLGLNPGLDGYEEEYDDRCGTLSPKLAALLDVARTCPRFTLGTPASLDVDQDYVVGHEWGQPFTPEHLANYADNPEARIALATWLNKDRP